MRKILAVICSFIIVFAFCSAVALHPQEVQAGDCDLEVNMKVSPHSLIIHSKGIGDSLTIHVDISYNLVDLDQPLYILVNGVEIHPVFTKADLRGDLVAKFSLKEIKEIDMPTGTFWDFELYGSTKDAQIFCGADHIRVKDNK